MILAYETATDICSVSFQNNKGEIFEKRIQGRSVHSDNLFLFTQELLIEHSFSIEELDAVLVSNGPGSYTGLRIAASSIKGILFGLEVPLFQVNTLAGFAQNVVDKVKDGSIHSIIDARRTHVYHQSFKNKEGLVKKSEISLQEISDFEAELITGDIIVGTGIQRLSEKARSITQTFDAEVISASNLILLYNSSPDSEYLKQTTPENLNPNYISSNQVNNSKS